MRWRTRRWLPIAAACVLAGCQAAPTAGPGPGPRAGAGASPGASSSNPALKTPAPTSSTAAPGNPVWDGVTFDESALAIPAELNTARAAAQSVVMWPPAADPVARCEIALHAMLYRAAWESNVGHGTRHFLLEPIPARELPAMHLTVREFRLRVLAALAKLDVPIAWTTAAPARPARHDFYPGTNHPATHLRITIAERRDGGRIVRGETEDWTRGGGSTRQGFTATLNGDTWSLARDRVRIER